MAAPGLSRCVKAFASCGKQGLPSQWAVAAHSWAALGCGLSSCGAQAQCPPRPPACGIFLDQRLNLCALH